MALRTWHTLFAWAALLQSASAAPLEVAEAAVYSQGKQLLVKAGPPQAGAIAWGSFADTGNETGWGELNVRTSGAFADEVQYKAAGMVEGFLTAEHIETGYLNALSYVFRNEVSKPAIKFLEEQEAWAKKQAKDAAAGDLFWHQTGAVLAQLEGLEAGYAQAGLPSEVPHWGFLMMNSVGDLFQIVQAVDPSRRIDFPGMSKVELLEFLRTQGMCSAIVKVPGGYEDLYMAHSSWFTYSNMDRIFKHYHFDPTVKVPTKRVSFSSYPGYLSSLDDFYMMDSGLGMVQTSNQVMNATVLKSIKPESVLSWQRVRVAHVLAETGSQWHDTFKQHYSGTYANQYMIVDFKLFEPGKPLKDGTLYVVEEMPGLLVGADQTERLRSGYWPSYNVPFYPSIFERSGYLDKRLGKDHSAYELAPRAKIFRRDQGKIVDMTSFKRVMRYANFSDPYAIGEGGEVDYFAAICARGDLSPTKPTMSGCYDSKVTSALKGFWNLSAEIVNGPTSVASDATGGASGNPVFEWTEKAKQPHFGQPQKFGFDFVRTSPAHLSGPMRKLAAEMIV
mmetsp:Transcript_49674/g.118319  ORF Transcript_49674/g.118319 Transcript_49674/m.118319 type:complete len:560 (-) Transcript_49674:105-1784(-)